MDGIGSAFQRFEKDAGDSKPSNDMSASGGEHQGMENVHSVHHINHGEHHSTHHIGHDGKVTHSSTHKAGEGAKEGGHECPFCGGGK